MRGAKTLGGIQQVAEEIFKGDNGSRNRKNEVYFTNTWALLPLFPTLIT